MKNNDFDFIASAFEEENIKAPESLSAENVIKKFDSKNVNNIVKIKSNKRGLRVAVAAVACFAVVITSLAVGNRVYKNKVIEANRPAVTETQELDGIVRFESYDEVRKTLKDMMPKDNYNGFGVFKNFEKGAELAATEEAADGALTNSASFGKTNTQVASVDEADIIKTDGKYIYYLSDEDYTEIRIYSADNGKTKLVSTIKAPKKDDSLFDEMYLSGDKLVTIGYCRNNGENPKTFVNIYSIKNAEKPELLSEYTQSGSYSTSRLYDGCVYVISNQYCYQYKKDCIPYVCCGDVEEQLPVENICAVEGSTRPSYAVIGAVSLDGKSKKQDTKAILGVSENVYCNEKNLYLAGTEYNENYYTDGGKTQLIKYSFNKTKVELKASATVKGTVNDQFSLDEKDGNLRIATTARDWDNGKDKNYLFILDENLNKTGEVTGFARGEHIEAVRYIGDTAYVITFEQTDPLFIINLSDPKKPEITGEVKIDGFSSSLTPVDENTLLGIGYSTKENEFGGIQTNGLKFVLFDISNKNNPKVLSEKELDDCESPVQSDHKALCINRDKGYFAVPFYNYGDDGADNSIAVIRANNGKLETTELDCGKTDYIERCTYIGDYLYAVCNESGEVLSFNVK